MCIRDSYYYYYYYYYYYCVCDCVCRNYDYERVNRLLRDKLDEATAANKSLVAELNALKQQCEEKELDWRKEEQVSMCCGL